MKLYSYFRSSTSYRVRIALNLKGLDYELIPVNLQNAEQKAKTFTERNPFGSLPMLETGDRDRMQSMALLEWLEEVHPAPPLLPIDVDDRYTVRELSYAIATELHAPLNLPVLTYLKSPLGHSQGEVDEWYRHWLARTLLPVERRLSQIGSGNYLFEAPGLFEVVLLPQLYNARRFAFDLSAMPHLNAIEAACLALPAFQRAHPDNQPDNPENN